MGAIFLPSEKGPFEICPVPFCPSMPESKRFVRLSNVMGGMNAIRHAEQRAGFCGGENCKPRNTSNSPS
jgi:hypothetical protein